jgi:alpha-tubulin suppressor-like RCC1 family protein
MVGQQIQLAAMTTDATGPVTWSSSNTAVATVDSAGLVKAVGLSPGQVTITATYGGASGTATLSTTFGMRFDDVSAGFNHTCGLSDSVAYCWGDNSSGQLGNGTTTNSATPLPVAGGLRFSTISAGGYQTCGLTPAGVAYCWGDNSAGQLGNGTTTNSATPLPVAGGLVFTGLTVGGKHVCAEPGAYCWGDNSSGQLGNGTMSSSSVPVLVPPKIGGLLYNAIESVSAGSSHTCGIARGNDGFIVFSVAVCWGENSSGQLGNGTTTNSAVPVALSVNPGFSLFSAGTFFTCGYNPDTEGVTSCWGNNGVGQLGNGTTTNSTAPVIVAGSLNFTSIRSGGKHACGIVNGATALNAYCWGDNSSGQLGNGTMTNGSTPVAVSGSLGFDKVSAGGLHTCGVTEGALYCWGDNTFGQLGNNWTTSSSTPVNVTGAP